MRILYLAVQVVSALASIQGVAALTTPILKDPNGAPGANQPPAELIDDFSELAGSDGPQTKAVERSTAAAILTLGKLSKELMLNTGASVLAGAILNAFGGSSQVIDLSEESLQKISDLVKEQIEAAWYNEEKADSTTFLQVASIYARRGEYNFTHPDPEDFGAIDGDRGLAFGYSLAAHGLINRINLYGLKSAPLYQVLLGTWIAFRKEHILLSQLLDDINKAKGKTTTLADAARQNFRHSCKSFADALVDYRDSYRNDVVPGYFDYREYYIVVSNHISSCRQTVRRRAYVGAYWEPFLTRAEMNDFSNVNHDYVKYFTSCRMNKCNPSSSGKRCWQEQQQLAAEWKNASMAEWADKIQGEYLTDDFDTNLDSLLAFHNGTLSV